VPLVEELVDQSVTRLTARSISNRWSLNHIDTLVLGCTHYPLLKALFEDIRSDIHLVDSAEAMAVIAAQLLTEKKLANPLRNPTPIPLFRDGCALSFSDNWRTLSGPDLSHVDLVNSKGE